MAKSRYADATKAARRAAMSAHKATSASKDAVSTAVQPPASDNATDLALGIHVRQLVAAGVATS